MVNLVSTQIDRHTKPIANEYNTRTTSKCSKPNSDVIHKNHNKLPDNSSDLYHNVNNFIIFHQNIRGISHKTDELIISLLLDIPHVLCLMDHHLQNEEIGNVHLDRNSLGAKFCRQTYITSKVVYVFILQTISSLTLLILTNTTERNI
jgi:hypothetical protein